MTSDQIIKFQKEFSSVNYWVGRIKRQAGKIRVLESWNKNGSHDDAIAKTIISLERTKKKAKEKLKNKTYEDWQSFSKNLSLINRRIRLAVTDLNKIKWLKELDILDWSSYSIPIKIIEKPKTPEECVHGENLLTCGICNYKVLNTNYIKKHITTK